MRKYCILTLIFSAVAAFVHSQDQGQNQAQAQAQAQAQTQTQTQTPDRAALKFGTGITPGDAKAHLSVLASDEYEGRNTGEKGGHMAAEYIAEYFKELGLAGPVEGSYYQEVDLVRQTIASSLFTLNDSTLRFLEDFLFFPDLEHLELETDEVIFAGYGIGAERYNDYENLDVKGKTVMILAGEPFDADGNSLVNGTPDFSEWSSNQEKKLQLLKEKEAAAILMVSRSVETYGKNYRSYFSGSSVKLTEDLAAAKENAPVPLLYISPAIASGILASGALSLEDLQRKIAATGQPASQPVTGVRIRLDIRRESSPLEAANVLSYLEGSDPALKDELIVLTAHYDHEGIIDGEVYNGADDDASGTTAVLEMAEAFSEAARAGKRPRRSLLFMAVTGEEKGLLGSRYYSEHPVFPLEHTIANLNIDMIGRVDSAHAGNPDYVYIIGSDKLSTELHRINENANATYTRLELDYTYNEPDDPNRFYYRSDHYNFAKHGIPIVFYFNGVHEDYHKPTDDIEKINFEALSKRTQLVFYTAWDLANRDERPAVDVENAFPESR